MATDDADAPDEIDFDDRELCSDDTCIGVIGEDGKCSECGRAGKRPAGGAKAGASTNGNGASANGTGASAAEKAKAHLDKAFKADKGGKPDKQPSKPPKASKGSGSGGGAGGSSGAGEGDGDWDDRELCSDGSCIGVIGKNGKCNECGKAAG